MFWSGKLAPYEVPNTYFLAPDEMAKFGIGKVAVRPDDDLTALSMYNATGVSKVRLVQVQWTAMPRLPLVSADWLKGGLPELLKPVSQ